MSRLARALLDELGPDELAELAARLGPYLPRTAPAADGWMNSTDAAGYLGISRDALNRLVTARRVPFSQDRPGARVYFCRAELQRWREEATP